MSDDPHHHALLHILRFEKQGEADHGQDVAGRRARQCDRKFFVDTNMADGTPSIPTTWSIRARGRRRRCGGVVLALGARVSACIPTFWAKASRASSSRSCGGSSLLGSRSRPLTVMYGWWSDVVKEPARPGPSHRRGRSSALRYGMMLFIASEVMFFVAWFWAYFDSSSALSDTAPERRCGPTIGRRLAAQGHRDIIDAVPPAAPQHADPADSRAPP